MRRMYIKYTAAALLIFSGAFAVHDNMLGKTLSTALVPGKQPAELATAEAGPEHTQADRGATSGQLYLSASLNFQGLEPLPVEQLRTLDIETLWLARCIFSETKQKQEQELIAWVVRNRVDTRYRGKQTYQDVVLDPMQFSAFNPGTRTRSYYMGLTPQSRVPGWQTALRIAHEVRHANPYQWRPFSARTRHFYSEQSMVGSKHPEWVSGMMPVVPARPYRIEPHRFRFYEGVF